MPITKIFKVYGSAGHRQRLSFFKSTRDDFSEGDNIRILEIQNSDITGTNEYSKMIITRNTDNECYNEAFGQWSDGAFENCNVGRLVEIDESENEISTPQWVEDGGLVFAPIPKK